ncbi:signal peptidase I [Streptomyces sp. NPDC007205]|uniref:signal peptidase I n=1 Tax=Streptomyces sp. NPDC007205 TaxID=3154316 RepID=UPI0033E8A511
MGDLPVDARSGSADEGRGRRVAAAVPAADSAVTPGRSFEAPGDDGEAGGQDPSDNPRAEEVSPKPKKHGSLWKELPILMCIALVLALLIKTFLVQAFSIPSASMQNALQVGDRVLVDKLTPWFGSEPARGEVVVFHDPDTWLAGEPTPRPGPVKKVLSWIGLMPSADEKDLIKRVIGIGGDTVECKGTGPLLVNGHALHEPYVYPGNTPCSFDDMGGQFKVKVPKGYIWVMGDHRQDSSDSRYNQFDKNHGMVSVDKVIGHAIVVAWPVSRWSTLPVPGTFHQLMGTRSAAPAIASQTATQ